MRIESMKKTIKKQSGSAFFLAMVVMQLASANEADETSVPSVPPADMERVVVQGQGVRDPAWISYKESFQAMKMYFESSSSDDPLEPRFVLRPLKQSTPASDELRLSLAGSTTKIGIPLDHYWGTVPYDGQAFDAESDFLLNTPPGTFKFIRTIAIKRLEGAYYETYLRRACERARDVMRAMNIGYRMALAFKKCVGVSFYHPPSDTNVANADFGELKRKESFAPSEFGILTFRFIADGERKVNLPYPVIAITPIFE